jgi:multicomponent Na+:H+ antiporter subunit D
MLLAPGLLVAASVVVGVLPQASQIAGRAGADASDSSGYAHDVLPAIPAGPAEVLPVVEWTVSGTLLSLASVVVAAALAAAALWPGRLPEPPAAVSNALKALHRAHSGHLGDYVAWLLVGVTILAVLFWL